MAKEDTVARWMLDEIRAKEHLHRWWATEEIARIFGSEFVYITDTGGLALERKVLKAFEKLTKTKVVFVSPSMYWRMRRPDDPPGRRQHG